MVSTKLLSFWCTAKKWVIFLRIGIVYLEKFPKSRTTFTFAQIKWGIEWNLPKSKNFFPICKKGYIRAFVVIILLVARRYVGWCIFVTNEHELWQLRHDLKCECSCIICPNVQNVCKCSKSCRLDIFFRIDSLGVTAAVFKKGLTINKLTESLHVWKCIR